MDVTTHQEDCEFVREGREWVFTARITVRMSDAERLELDGIRVEAFPWTRFRLKLSVQPPGAGLGGWRYEVRDIVWRDDDTGEHQVVCSGTRPTWDAAYLGGQFALSAARRAALDDDRTAPFTLPLTRAGK